MPIPIVLTNAGASHAVFCYSSDLVDASKRLQGFLQGTYVRITLTNSGTVRQVSGPIDELCNVAWLVGHGGSDNARISTRGGGVYIETMAILDWCVGNGYYYVIDTCCAPDVRKIVAREYRGLDYYSAPDGHEVTQIVNSPTLDAWWDANAIDRRSGFDGGGDDI